MEIRILGAHNLESPSTRHTCFLIDAVMTVDAGSLVSALTPVEVAGIRAMLLTHRHFDHVRDLPTIGLMGLGTPPPISVYALPETLTEVTSRLMDGVLYPDFTVPLGDRPAKYVTHPITPGEVFQALEYQVRAIRVPHGPPAVGYVVHGSSGTWAYSGDTGGGLLPFFQDPLGLDALCVEVTFSNALDQMAETTGHLTPHRLGLQLGEAREQQAQLPRIFVVHMHPDHEEQIRRELEEVATSTGTEIVPATEDLRITI